MRLTRSRVRRHYTPLEGSVSDQHRVVETLDEFRYEIVAETLGEFRYEIVEAFDP